MRERRTYPNWPNSLVRVTHLPSGHIVEAEGRSQYRARAKCFEMLEGKLWAFPEGHDHPQELVRTYDIEGDFTVNERTGETRPGVQSFLDGSIDIGPDHQ